MEFFNEMMIMFVMYFMMTFTDWMPDHEVREKLGYMCMVFVSTHIVVNIMVIGQESIR